MFIIRHKVHGWIFDYYADFFLHPASAESLPERVAARRHLVSCAAFLHILKKAVLHGKLGGANKGLGEAPKSCTRKEHESTTNSIAKRGQG
ncbi:MAG: hypothetical protein U0I27_12630, partial [Christensenellales bacterium]|nr:hypothetical protein [Christensenellales bacterium]